MNLVLINVKMTTVDIYESNYIDFGHPNSHEHMWAS